MDVMRRTCFVLAALAVAIYTAIEAMPGPDPTFRALCPNYDSVRVYRVDWATRSNVYVKTVPADCGPPDAIQAGYLGD